MSGSRNRNSKSGSTGGNGRSGAAGGKGNGKGPASSRQTGSRKGSDGTYTYGSGATRSKNQGGSRSGGHSQKGQGSGRYGAKSRGGSDSRDEGSGSGRSRGGGSGPRGASSNIIFGKRSVLEALEAGVPLEGISFAEGLSRGEAVDRIRELARESSVPIDSVTRSYMDGRANGINHQGVMATAKPYGYSSIREMTDGAADSDAALVYVLDHITDVGNFGAIIRTAEVVGASGIVIPNRRSVDVVPSVYKTSSGAVSRMKVAKVPNISAALDELRDAGFWIAGASEKAEASCWDSPLDGKIAIVMGNEENGLSSLVQRECDFLARLPQRGSVGSLNVSCAAAAMGYEWMRQSTMKGQLSGESEETAGTDDVLEISGEAVGQVGDSLPEPGDPDDRANLPQAGEGAADDGLR